jgi:hypothetical protein
MNNNSDYDAQEHSTFIIDEDNVDALVWSKDEEVNKNYFTLPPKGKVNAKHSLTQSNLALTETLDSIEKEQIEKDKEIVTPKEEQQEQRSDNSDVFTISSVLEKIEVSTTVLPRLKIKRLALSADDKETRVEINPPADINTGKEVVTNSLSNWVIQFMSYELPINKDTAVKKFSAIGQLYLGQKNSDKNKILNCVVSRSFQSKEEASAALKKAGLNGWVTTNNVYTNITPIN